MRPVGDEKGGSSYGMAINGLFEYSWLANQRPFYNVYPIAIELCGGAQLTMTWGDILLPTRNLLLRFPVGDEPFKMSCVLARAPSSESISSPIGFHESWRKQFLYAASLPLGAVIHSTDGESHSPQIWGYDSHDSGGRLLRDEVIKDTLIERSAADSTGGDHELFGQRADFLVRLLAFIGLLANGTDLITPAILAADREEYDATSDEARRRWLEERAASRQGRGFDIGRSMEIERATSPHWRCPHIALFHTGPGRSVPVLKVRSGCVVVPRDMSQVPTGYLGPEKEGEEHKELPAVFRTPIPSRMRFQVLRRDGYRCRLCGMTAEDGITLECDHIIAVAKSGKTDPLNLWTLCRPCNNGKSDSDLHLALEENLAMEKARKEVKRGIRV